MVRDGSAILAVTRPPVEGSSREADRSLDGASPVGAGCDRLLIGSLATGAYPAANGPGDRLCQPWEPRSSVSLLVFAFPIEVREGPSHCLVVELIRRKVGPEGV